MNLSQEDMTPPVQGDKAELVAIPRSLRGRAFP